MTSRERVGGEGKMIEPLVRHINGSLILSQTPRKKGKVRTWFNSVVRESLEGDTFEGETVRVGVGRGCRASMSPAN